VPCDSRRLPGQSLTQRKEEIRTTIAKLSAAIIAGRVKPKVSKEGGIIFEGWLNQDRNRITDSCALRQVTATGSALALQAIQRAEILAGRKLDRQAIAQGLHTHDGVHFHHHKG